MLSLQTGFCWAAFKVILSVVIGSHGSPSQTDSSGTQRLALWQARWPQLLRSTAERAVRV